MSQVMNVVDQASKTTAVINFDLLSTDIDATVPTIYVGWKSTPAYMFVHKIENLYVTPTFDTTQSFNVDYWGLMFYFKKDPVTCAWTLSYQYSGPIFFPVPLTN